MTHRLPLHPLAALALVLLLLQGCARDTTVSGTVTYEGEPVKDGFITFYPEDSGGVSRGGEICDGHYAVHGLAPGKKRVRVVAQPQPQLVENKRSGTRTVYLRPPEKPIPAGAVGNGEVVDLVAGPQTCDFTLRRPARK